MVFKSSKLFGSTGDGNEKWRISFIRSAIIWVLVSASGMVSSAALPPLNWSGCAFFAFVPLLLATFHSNKKTAFFLGFSFGWFWGVTAFQFLREIQGSMGVLPYLLATILASYFGVFALLVRMVHDKLRFTFQERMMTFSERVAIAPKLRFHSEFIFCTAITALYVMLEWGRAFALPWNYLSTTQHQNLALLQIASFGGSYIISALIFFCNVSMAAAIDSAYLNIRSGTARKIPWCFLLAAMLLAGSGIYGVWRMATFEYKETVLVRFGLVQGNISQRRAGGIAESKEAMEINFALANQLALLPEPPEMVIMPESATPIPYSDGSSIAHELRWRLYNFVEKTRIPLLFGAIDVEFLPNDQYKTFNRAMLFRPGKSGYIEKFDKIERVPFGEYVPFRKFLPEFVVKIIDMNRDLTPGSDYTPLNLLPHVRAGISICFEDVFPSVARREALLGANLLAVITNDAWYPTSAEPEQHFANCILRTIETGLPMIRCGNNSASIVLSPTGVVTDGLMLYQDGTPDPISRGRAAGVVSINVPLEPVETIHTKFGNWFVYLMLAVSVFSVSGASAVWFCDKKRILREVNIEI